MKTLLTILLGCMAATCLSQNASLTFGRYTDCIHRGGICSISNSSNSNKSSSTNPNATFIQNQDGTTTLRIFRQMITKENEEKLFGVAIIEQNKSTIVFVQHDPMPLSPEISLMTAENPSKQQSVLAAKQYLTTITQFYIDILITEND